MHIYIFGSLCRGDVDVRSDVDLLAIVNGRDLRLSKDTFSIYSYKRISELWDEGNAFAWHLSLESRLVYASDGRDFLSSLGSPLPYTSGTKDCERFRQLFEGSSEAVLDGTPSVVFELSTMFLALRNLATCYSLAMQQPPRFGRHAAIQLGEKSLTLPRNFYELLEQARILSTRGAGANIESIDNASVQAGIRICREWVAKLCAEVTGHG